MNLCFLPIIISGHLSLSRYAARYTYHRSGLMVAKHEINQREVNFDVSMPGL